jgi:hypothetical protein
MAKDFKHKTPPDRRIKDKVAIVGFTDHRVLAYKLPREEWEVWGINELYRVGDSPIANFDRWFEMEIPVYMQEHYPDIPPSVAFPREELKKLSIEKLGRVYFTSSIAWELALAIKLGFKEIHIYGVDMAQDSEYARERNCCEAWLGVAAGMGIKVHVPPTSDLLKCIGEYGFGDEGTEFSLKVKERTDWLHQQDNDFLTQIRKMEAEYPQIRERILAEYQQKIDALVGERDAKLHALDKEFHEKHGHLSAQRNQVFGAILDCNFWGRSWGITAASDRSLSPDRSKDPRTGIKEDVTPRQSQDMGVNPARAIAEPVAA